MKGHLRFIKNFCFAHKPRNIFFLHLEQEFNGGTLTECNHLKDVKKKAVCFHFIKASRNFVFIIKIKRPRVKLDTAEDVA